MTRGGRPLRFLIAGGWNTVFGYGFYVALYYLTRPLVTAAGMPVEAHYLGVLVVANVVAVAQAYLAYRFFVFRSRADVATEFARFSLVYAVTFAFNLVALPVLVRNTSLGPVLAQGIVVVVASAISYAAHVTFSFRGHGESR